MLRKSRNDFTVLEKIKSLEITLVVNRRLARFILLREITSGVWIENWST